jgi:F-type H+-transporting ATPase subunit delta
VKTELEGVASKYAEAILALAVAPSAPGLDEAVGSDLTGISRVMQDSADLRMILGHPSIPADQKKAFLVSLFSKKINELTLRLLELLNDKRRLDLIPQIATKYHSLLNERKQIVTANLVCADQLGDKALADIKARLAEHLGKKLDLEVTVDRSLIGGFQLKLGDQVIDGSIKSKLRAIEKTLLSV